MNILFVIDTHNIQSSKLCSLTKLMTTVWLRTDAVLKLTWPLTSLQHGQKPWPRKHDYVSVSSLYNGLNIYQDNVNKTTTFWIVCFWFNDCKMKIKAAFESIFQSSFHDLYRGPTWNWTCLHVYHIPGNHTVTYISFSVGVEAIPL